MKISIITATRNSGRTLRDTMMSVLRQDWADFEHIIIDGASTDNTLSVIQELEPQYKGRLKYISEPDKGIYDAMNKGLRLATGDVVGTLNSDDFFSAPDILRLVASNIEHADAVYGDLQYITGDDVSQGTRFYSSRRFRRWKMPMGFMPAHPTFYCRRSVYDKYGLFDPTIRIAADFELLLRFIYLHNISTRYIRRCMVVMRVGGVSTSGLKSHRQIMKDHFEAYRKNGVRSNIILEGSRYINKLVEIAYYRIRQKLSGRSNNVGVAKAVSPSEFIKGWK